MRVYKTKKLLWRKWNYQQQEETRYRMGENYASDRINIKTRVFKELTNSAAKKQIFDPEHHHS